MLLNIYRMLLLTGASVFSQVLFAETTDGLLLYERHCAVCHGENGGGGVGIPLNLPAFLSVASDGYLRNTVREGRPGRVMPAFSRLADAEVNAIIAQIRGWSGGPAPQYAQDKSIGQANRGKELYSGHCATCHGAQGEGGTGTGVTYSRPRGAPVMAPALNNHGFQSSISDAMLKSTLLQGREGTPMPSLKTLGLNDADADDLIAYIRQLSIQPVAKIDTDAKPVIQFDSAYDLQQTLENVKQAVVGRNFRIIREQYLEQGMAEEGQENRRQIILYFCNFAFLNEALAIDPRVGLFLPCRVTLVETEQGVRVMSVNPLMLSHLFNNDELDKACKEMRRTYEEIMEEATL